MHFQIIILLYLIMTNYSWNPLLKVGFRFSFIFILSIILMMNNGAFPIVHIIVNPLSKLMQQFAHWFAKNIIHYKYDYSIVTNGSGDTSYNWMSLLLLFLIAVLGSLIWSIAAKKRKNYQKCYYWLTVIIRYYIAFMLINYGLVKLDHAQMPPPSLTRLMQPLGEFSPMGLAWTYFGYSKGYNIFVGIMEVSAGLLLFRRTVVLGALLSIAISVNIMTVNYFFDVPVKLLSTVLFALSLFLLLPYIKPLYNFLLLGKASQIDKIIKPKFNKTWINKVLIFLKIAFIGIFVAQQSFAFINRDKIYSQYFKRSPLNGIYMIDKSSDLGTIIPKDWAYIVFEYEGHASTRDIYYKEKSVNPVIDVEANKISLNNYTFNYTVLENGDISLQKEFDDHTQEVKLIKQKSEEFELMKRGFNLIQEYPHNR